MIAVILMLLGGFSVAASSTLAGLTMTGNRQTIEEAMKWQSEHYDISFYEKTEKSEYTIPGYKDYILHAELLKSPTPSDRYMIISHGYTDNRRGSLKYAKMYLDMGFNCIIYDLRGHGENEKTFTTYGIREGRDLAYIVKDTRKRYSGIKQLGLHGESLGAASTITSLKYKPKVDFVVADCGFSDIENVLRGGFRNSHIPGFLFDLADLGARLRYHYALRDMRPIDSLAENEIPVLFIHGADDTFILPKNSQDMYDKTKGKKEIFFMPGAGHAESVLKDAEKYREIVEGFVKGF